MSDIIAFMETQYSKKELLRIAKRVNNKKRTYLLVNPLQAKHIPVSPTSSLNMMKSLGNKVSSLYGAAGLVIGFAETATAIGAVVAECLGDNCRYLHTTRERLSAENNCLEFLEEHSHATEQKLSSVNLQDYFESTDIVVLVDDELSTGKTLINMVSVMRSSFPVLNNKTIVAASIINRMSADNIERLKESNISYVCLLKLEEDYTDQLREIEIKEAEAAEATHNWKNESIDYKVQNPRLGVSIREYTQALARISNDFIKNNVGSIIGNVLVLGTEESMYPALILGREIEKTNFADSVKCHATTRSPIGIANNPGYPIANGYKLHSVYDRERTTFIYNVDLYDTVIIVSDADHPCTEGLDELQTIFKARGINNFLVLLGDEHV